MEIEDMSVLERRRIEAMVLGPMIRAFQGELGEERANAIARRVITEIAHQQGKELAERLGSDRLDSYASGKGAWRKGNALEIETLQQSPERYDFNVTRCRYAEMYRDLGYQDLGAILSCGRDFEFPYGFNPRLKLTRTQTIMQGAPFCDFRYRLEQEDDAASARD